MAPILATDVAPSLQPFVVEVGAEIPVTVPVVTHLAWLPVLYPIFQFLPDGALLAAEPNDGRAVIVGADGSIRFDQTLPRMRALMVGPESVLYSAEPSAAGGLTLVAYATTGTRAGSAVGSWDISSACSSGACSDLQLGATGITGGTTSTVIVAYVDETGDPSGASWSNPAAPAVSRDRQTANGVQTVSTTDLVTVGDTTWSVQASKVSSVMTTTYTPQPDGSVTAVFRSGQFQFERLVWLHRDGSATQFNTDHLGIASFPNAVVDGGVLAIRFVEDAAELIRIDLPAAAPLSQTT